MPCYVDELKQTVATGGQARRVGARNGHRWCHLVADTFTELQVMADLLGLKLEWLQKGGDGFQHYDLTPGRRSLAVDLGAQEVTSREIVKIRWKHREGRKHEMPD